MTDPQISLALESTEPWWQADDTRLEVQAPNAEAAAEKAKALGTDLPPEAWTPTH